MEQFPPHKFPNNFNQSIINTILSTRATMVSAALQLRVFLDHPSNHPSNHPLGLPFKDGVANTTSAQFPYHPGGGADYRGNLRVPRAQRFDEYYRCYPLIMAPGAERPELNYGSKILLPPSALDKVSRLHVQWPIMLELLNVAASKHTHAGVLEFVAEEGRAYIPQWVCSVLSLIFGSGILTVGR